MGATNNKTNDGDNLPVDISSNTDAEDKCMSSKHEILQQINDAINNGSKLEATIIFGAYTNYSYKVYVDHQPSFLFMPSFVSTMHCRIPPI